jgi:hypothetical protein
VNDNARKWVEALESGRFKQGTEVLHRVTPNGETLCCLGVACVLAIEDGWPVEARQARGDVVYDGEREGLPELVRRWLGLRNGAGRRNGDGGEHTFLTNDNDDGKSFAEIAQIIRTHPELFEDEAAA